VRFAQLIVPDIDFRVHYGEELPFEPSLFDLVSAIEVIEHVESEAEEQFLTELRRVLRKGGLLILTTPSWNLPLTNHHFRHYSAGRLCELLERTGFDVLDLRGQSIPCFGRRRKIRKWMNLFPVIWKIWRFTYRETRPEKSLNLIVAARPTEDT
jgi:SAM-dependent methyltransferase